MGDNVWKKVLAVWGVLGISFMAGCGTTNKNLNEASLSSPETRLSFVLQELKENPKDANVYYKLSQVYAELDSIDYALVTIDTALSLDPGKNQARLMRAGLLFKKNRLKEGYAEYLKVLKSENGDEFVTEIRAHLGQPYPVYQLSRGDYNNAFPCFSPDDNRIAFQTDRDGNWEIYLMDANGAQELRVTNHPAQDEMPVFGFEGIVIAFTSTRDDSVHKARLDKLRNIYFMDLNNGKVNHLTAHEADDWYPALSEKGNKMVFVSERDDMREVAFHEKWSDIYIQDLNDASVIRLTQNEADDSSPSLSADGKWIVFTSNRTGSYQLYRMNINGKLVEQLTFMNGNLGSPHFSHDGKKIAFFADVNGNYDIFMMESNGKNMEQITDDPAQDCYPSFSSDRRKIIFHSNRTGKYQLYWIDLMNPLTQEELIKQLEQRTASMN